jgi:hypothetical protein
MMRPIRVWVPALLICTAIVQGSGGEGRQEAGTEDTRGSADWQIAAADPPLTSYRAFRTLTAEARNGHVQARLTAWTSLDPVAGFQYSIVNEEGSGTIRQKVLRAALEAERRIQRSDEAAKGAITRQNYTFDQPLDAGDGLVRVGIQPKRSDTLLVLGSVLLTEPGGDLVRVEGTVSKRPSVWTRDVRVVREYTRIAGVRVPIEMRSVARVLLVGRATFSMSYDYTSINGAPVEPGAPLLARFGTVR